MSQSILAMATELTSALIQAGQIPPEALQETLQKTYTSLMDLKTKGENGATTPALGNWRKSITKHTVTCLECGAAYKQLSIRHLRQHDLNGQSYRAKYRIPKTQPLAAKANTARRRQMAQEIKPWEKAPTFVKAQRVKKAGRKRVVRTKA